MGIQCGPPPVTEQDRTVDGFLRTLAWQLDNAIMSYRQSRRWWQFGLMTPARWTAYERMRTVCELSYAALLISDAHDGNAIDRLNSLVRIASQYI